MYTPVELFQDSIEMFLGGGGIFHDVENLYRKLISIRAVQERAEVLFQTLKV